MAVNTVKALINGQTYTLSYDATSKTYKTTITAPGTSSWNNNAGHYYPATVTATDVAGNSVTATDSDPALGESLKLKVTEKVAPISTITTPTAGARIISNKPTISWTVTDADSGVNPDSISITVNAKAATTAGITKTLAGKTYSCSYTLSEALPDGNNVIKVDAKDFDNNAAIQKSVSFIVDTIAPTLSVSSPEDGLITNVALCELSGLTNDATSSPCTVTVKLNDSAATPVTVNADGSFTKSVTFKEGVNSLVVTATDAAGKETSVMRTVTLDTKAPVISAVTMVPNPVDCGATYVISVTVSD